MLYCEHLCVPISLTRGEQSCLIHPRMPKSAWGITVARMEGCVYLLTCMNFQCSGKPRSIHICATLLCQSCSKLLCRVLQVGFPWKQTLRWRLTRRMFITKCFLDLHLWKEKKKKKKKQDRAEKDVKLWCCLGGSLSWHYKDFWGWNVPRWNRRAELSLHVFSSTLEGGVTSCLVNAWRAVIIKGDTASYKHH